MEETLPGKQKQVSPLPRNVPFSINFNEEDPPNVTRERLLHEEKQLLHSSSTLSGIDTNRAPCFLNHATQDYGQSLPRLESGYEVTV